MVPGSRAYFLHNIIHDWTDKEAASILENLAPAMKKGYSKLLICEIVLPKTGCPANSATLDVAMLALLSSGERTEGRWNDLLTSTGYKVVKWWADPAGGETVIEAELA